MDRASGFVFYSKLSNDCLDLLIETRNYLRDQSGRDQEKMTFYQRLAMTCLAIRLTTQLTDIMGWVLQKKAEFSPEFPPQEKKEYAWNTLPTMNADSQDLPEAFLAIVARSERLFERAQRLNVKQR